MREGKFWLCLWVSVCTFIIVITSISLIYFYTQNTQIVRLIEAGHDPIASYCAVTGITDSSTKAILCSENKNS